MKLLFMPLLFTPLLFMPLRFMPLRFMPLRRRDGRGGIVTREHPRPVRVLPSIEFPVLGARRGGPAPPSGHATMRAMPMRADCKHYESRTYPTGDAVRKCNLDLAPEAPWRCPEDCPSFAPRLVDVNWSHGNLTAPGTSPEPPGLDQGAAELLDAAEDIVNAAGAEIVAEMEERKARQARKGRKRWKKRR